MHKVLVTGATGFVGSYLVKKLIDRGDDVHGIKRASSKLHLLGDYAEKVTWTEGDVLDIFSVQAAMEGIEQVYHAAAMISFLPGEREKMMKVNVEGTATMVNAALECGVKKFLHVSSISAFGRSRTDQDIDEETEWYNGKRNTNYAISKFFAEREIWRAQAEGLTTVIVNPSTILGAGDWRNGPGMIFTRIWNGLKFYTKGTSGFVDVRDVVDIMIRLMDSEISNERFILSAENRSFKDLFTAIATEFGLKPPSIEAGRLLGEMAWRVDTFKGWLTGSDPLITKETVRMASSNYRYKNNKIKRALNVRFRPLDETIKETCRHFKDSINARQPYAVFD